MDDATLCRIVSESLGLLNKLNPESKSVRTKDVRIEDSVILVKFYAETRDMNSVRAEIAAVAAALSGLLVTNELSERPILHYAIQAWDDDKAWLTYALCSAEAAEKIGQGKALDWLRATQFQENTDDWRLARAKALASRVEIGLRDAIDAIATASAGPSWWLAMTGDMAHARKEAERQARKAGLSDPSPRELLDYTYLKDLTEIVTRNWSDFESLWSDKAEFEKRQGRMNVLRRSEAHNRSIDEGSLAELEQLYEYVLSGIANANPDVVPQYVTERWRLTLLRWVRRLQKSWGAGQVRRDLDENKERLARFREVAEDSLEELEEMQIPPGREEQHRKLLESVRLAAGAAAGILGAANTMDIPKLESASERFEESMNGIRQVEEMFLLWRG